MTTAKNLEEWNRQYQKNETVCKCGGAVYREREPGGSTQCPKCGNDARIEYWVQCGKNHNDDCPYLDIEPNEVEVITCPDCGTMDV